MRRTGPALLLLVLALNPASTQAQRADSTRAIIASDTAFVIDVDGLVPENIARDPSTSGFFIGDVFGRRILYRADEGGLREFAGQSVLRGSVLGMKPDSARHLLWVNVYANSARMSDAERLSTPRSALLAFDLTNGELKHRYLPADSLEPHLFNDLVLTPNGEVLLTDSEAGKIYRVATVADSLRVWIEPRSAFTYPNGITLESSGRTLYVAHLEGISAIDIETRAIQRLQPPRDHTLGGFDGLYSIGSQLVGIENAGKVGNRVLAFKVTPAGQVIDVRELERGHPAYHIPTTGAVVGRTLYYIANAQLDRMPARGTVAHQPLDPIVVLKLHITDSRAR